jgi:glycosyltransferase involved in cell wall biosynthesis
MLLQAGTEMQPDEAKRRGVLILEQGGRGGVTDYTVSLSAALADRGWSVEIATATDHLYPPHPGVKPLPVFHYLRAGSRVRDALRKVKLGAVINGLRFLAAIPAVVRAGRRAAVVHSQGWELAPLGVLMLGALRLAGCTIVQTEHNTFERGPMSFRRSHSVMGAIARRTIVHTNWDVDQLWDTAKHKADVIPHGEYGGLARTGGSADRAEARAELGIPQDAPVTLMFGQLRHDKGIGDLVEAVRQVPDLYLVMGGLNTGGLDEVADQLESPELKGRVIIREGFLSMAEAAKLFAATDTASLPYQVASQSGVLLLSYGFARPVIVYPVGGLPEAVVEGETGWVCERSDPDALAATLRASVEAGWPECERRGAAGARLSDERYSWPEIARLTEDVYYHALGIPQPALATAVDLS